MSEQKPKYITTTLPYVNASPHIGFGLEMVQADTLARYWRLMGKDVFFSTGTDEHGQKIAEKAKEYRLKNKQKLCEKTKEKIECDICKCMVNKGHFVRHTRSLKHQNNIDN